MTDYSISNKKITPRLFSNDLVERLSHVHPITPLILYLPLIIYGLWVGILNQSLISVLFFFVVGTFTWTLVEYLIHRFIFHYEPHGRGTQRLHFIIHGVHHKYPSDPMRLVVPPTISVAVTVAILVALMAMFGPIHPWPYGAGFAFGYLAYDMTHYALHHFPCKNRKVGTWLKRYHLRHHFRDETCGFGVSSPVWDYVFRTLPAKNRPSPRKTE